MDCSPIFLHNGVVRAKIRKIGDGNLELLTIITHNMVNNFA